jgi:putative zinc finger/helix-turn-helix YgiT family protein
MNECILCGANNVEVIKDKPYNYKEGGIEVTLHGLTQYYCQACDETFTPIPAPKKLHQATGQIICDTNKSLLTGDEIKFLRKTMELGSKELAKIMGVNVSTVSRWENNKKEIGDSNDRLLRSIFMLEYPCLSTNTCDRLKEMPAKRKKIKNKNILSLNPAEWLMNNCCSASV